MNQRALYHSLVEALADTPVVFLRGARQTGKTTLVRQFPAGVVTQLGQASDKSPQAPRL